MDDQITDQTALLAHIAELRKQDYHVGPMGLPAGATAAEIPAAMQAAWDDYWINYRHASVDVVATGGTIMRTGPDSAVYARMGLQPLNLTRGTNLNWFANQDAKVADAWATAFGFKPVPL